MRLSNLLLPLALLLSIGSVCAEHPMIGIWENWAVNALYSRYCCLPSSIQIVDTGNSRLNATYNYSGNNEKCSMMFDTVMTYESQSQQLVVYNSSGVNREKYISDVTRRGGLQFKFEVVSGKKGPELNIYTQDGVHDNICNITMLTRYDNPAPTPPPNPKSDYSLLYAGIAFCVILGAFAAYKRNQDQKLQANLAQTNASFDASMQYGQPQGGYNAPNQFPNTQVNMNYGGGNRF